MNIKKLNLTAFGKYQNKNVHFENGINIVFGENESGKSTIHKFIEAMFFGFFKDQKNRRAYSDDYHKYLPINSNFYGGNLILEDNFSEIRVERNLLKGKDKVVLYDSTGKDISSEFTYDNGTKLFMPLDPTMMNRSIYNNTISISQLGCGTSKDLAEELKDKLANFGHSKADLSVQNAIETLTTSLHNLGTQKRKNTPMYDATTSLDQLQKEKNNIIDAMGKVAQLREEASVLDYEIQKRMMSKENLTKNIEAVQSYNCVVKLKEYSDKLDENKKIIQEISQLNYADVSEQDVHRINKLSDEVNILEKQVEVTNEKMKLCLAETFEVEKKSLSNDFPFTEKQIEQDYNDIQRIYHEKNILDYKKEDSNGFLLEDKVKTLKEDIRTRGLITAVSISTSVLGLIIGVMLNPFFYLLCVFLLIGLLSYKQIDGKTKEINAVNEKLNQIRDSMKSTEDQLERIEININEIIQKYSCNDYEDFVGHYYDEYKKLTGEVKDLNGKLIVLKERNNNYKEYIQHAEIEIKKGKDEITRLLKKNHVASQEELEDNLNQFMRAKELKSQLEQGNSLLERIIDPKDLEIITKIADSYPDLEQYHVPDNVNSLITTIKQIEEEIKVKELEKSNVEGRIDSINNQSGNLSDIENEITFVQNKISVIQSKEKSLNLAIHTIQNISEEIHKELAPELNNLLGKILKDITGKYNSVKVTKDLDIRLEDPMYDQLLHVSQLSSGTIDQVYFAFRMGLNDFLSKSEYPILLDETFVQYDDNRLANVLKYLVNAAQTRQIIIFTSQDREKRLIKQFTNSFNTIEL